MTANVHPRWLVCRFIIESVPLVGVKHTVSVWFTRTIVPTKIKSFDMEFGRVRKTETIYLHDGQSEEGYFQNVLKNNRIRQFVLNNQMFLTLKIFVVLICGQKCWLFGITEISRQTSLLSFLFDCLRPPLLPLSVCLYINATKGPCEYAISKKKWSSVIRWYYNNFYFFFFV